MPCRLEEPNRRIAMLKKYRFMFAGFILWPIVMAMLAQLGRPVSWDSTLQLLMAITALVGIGGVVLEGWHLYHRKGRN